MAIDRDALMALEIPDAEQTYTERDTILYALSIGLGYEPTNEQALRYCYEKDLRALPTMPLVTATPGFWMRDLETGIDFTQVVHGDQAIIIHRPPPVAATVIGVTKIVEIIDKGPGRGAIVIFERNLFESASGDLIATMRQSNFCRADGGFGAPSPPVPKPPELPSSAPTHIVDLPTRPETALFYRLAADLNPLHAEPAVARAAGFPRPILHGLATFGFVGHAILQAVCDYDDTMISSLTGRFSSPVFPGETIRTEIWREGDLARFRALAIERGVVVLSSGYARLALCNHRHGGTE